MSFWVYILRCVDGSYYTGHTDDLERRVAQHQSGELPGYTHDRRPVELVFSETFAERIDALEREQQIKDWSRKKKEALFRSDFSAVTAASETSRHSSRLRSTSARSEREDNPTGKPEDRPLRASVERVETHAGTARAPHPVIVLVRPQLGENIGKAARAMLNFGLTEMRLVAPRDGWPNPDAGPSAAGADQVLADAQIYETLAEAVADCAHVYATTVRKRGVTKPVVTPQEAAREILVAPGRSAIVFGPERSGLETDDVALARAILTVPVNPEFGSLNLAQAVILCAYEWSKHRSLAQPTVTELLPPAPQDELEGMIGQLEVMLEDAGYFFPPSRVTATKRTLRTLLTKPGWNHLEVRTLRGVLSALANPRSR
ncbi:TrmJ/YjtD family RNA methyltransferase [Sphingobium nicotianae]|uniref:tRNA (cytidine/uridine-2'-O-)-methyltransferase TrmJ n=1 Tax=Sphingobium nicotianae TaxID=2782607 RepID=A0A9X1IRW6_9SPHN|nr:TrmJ/YjtD family RNA methyltransferase [Sphingobium nicotianae]MBT2187545.1 TrmJ/YjtD family RNA methyltransferase [Sphingobium nicotianae]